MDAWITGWTGGWLGVWKRGWGNGVENAGVRKRAVSLGFKEVVAARHGTAAMASKTRYCGYGRTWYCGYAVMDGGFWRQLQWEGGVEGGGKTGVCRGKLGSERGRDRGLQRRLGRGRGLRGVVVRQAHARVQGSLQGVGHQTRACSKALPYPKSVSSFVTPLILPVLH
eukprot:365124-Chlamydomonas_euryale.AAC.14